MDAPDLPPVQSVTAKEYKEPKRKIKSNLPDRKVKRSIPAALSSVKKTKTLVRERDQFVQQLRLERETKERQEHDAATSIQALFRGHLVRRPEMSGAQIAQAKSEVLAAGIIRAQLKYLNEQTDKILSAKDDESTPEWKLALRKRQAAKEQQEKLRELREIAAVVVQATLRRRFAKQAIKIETRLQQEEGVLRALTRFQAIYRGFWLRERKRQKDMDNADKAATRIQAAYRMFLAKKRLWQLRLKKQREFRRETCATLLQRVVRGHIARKRVLLLFQQHEACVMQRYWRGACVRWRRWRRAQAQLSASVRIQCAIRSSFARQELSKRQAVAKRIREAAAAKALAELQERSATRIQCMERRRVASQFVQRRRLEVHQRATGAMQRIVRGGLARRRVAAIRQKLREEQAAIDIQRVSRGRADRKVVSQMRAANQSEEEAAAAVKLQSIARMRAGKREAQRRRSFARTVRATVFAQKIARGFMARLRVAQERRRRMAALEAEAEAAPRRRNKGRRRGKKKGGDDGEDTARSEVDVAAPPKAVPASEEPVDMSSKVLPPIDPDAP